MTFSERYAALLGLGGLLGEIADQPGAEPVFEQARNRQPWFTAETIRQSIRAWSAALQEPSLKAWIASYPELTHYTGSKLVGTVNAGNIPFVGLHDLLCVFLAGHRYQAKNASEDPILLPWLVQEWSKQYPEIADRISFVERLTGCDAYIATGSDNSSRYFEYYFGRYPHIIRRNRNGIAILSGHESDEQLAGLGKDVFSYYGLGCRNVSKLFVPADYDMARFFEAMYPFHHVMGHHKYMNNFDHHHTVYLLKSVPFLQNNFLILKEESVAIASPLAVVYYERYNDLDQLLDKLKQKSEMIQCAVADAALHSKLAECGLRRVDFGETQHPGLADYADGTDTMRFLLGL
ncbi:MAG: acyl-CoA reductase [Bacteroidota bacterium]